MLKVTDETVMGEKIYTHGAAKLFEKGKAIIACKKDGVFGKLLALQLPRGMADYGQDTFRLFWALFDKLVGTITFFEKAQDAIDRWLLDGWDVYTIDGEEDLKEFLREVLNGETLTKS